jgi:hypothetical protein
MVSLEIVVNRCHTRVTAPIRRELTMEEDAAPRGETRRRCALARPSISNAADSAQDRDADFAELGFRPP